MTELELQAIRERAEKATAGTWIKYDEHGKWICNYPRWDFIAEVKEDADYEFITNAHSDIPKLLAEIKRLHAYYYEKLGEEAAREQELLLEVEICEAEIKRLKDELAANKYRDLEDALEDAFGERMQINAEKYAEIIRKELGDRK